MFEDLELSLSEGSDDEYSESMEMSNKTKANAVLRAAMTELEKALADTNRILKERDESIAKLRIEISESARTIEDKGTRLTEMAEELVNTKEELSLNEAKMLQLKMENTRLKATLEDLRGEKINFVQSPTTIKCPSGSKSNRIKPPPLAIPLHQKYDATAEKALQSHLRIRFLRDAFFYYMIDFHSDEQIKAILAILDYEDKRGDLVNEAHRMRKNGRKFTANEVSTRCLTFVQEEIR